MRRWTIKNVLALSLATLILGSNSVMAATSTVWKEAPAKYYDASKLYDNAQRDGYSFCINKLAKTGDYKDKSDYKKLEVWLVVTNPKMRLSRGQEKNQWFFTANKNHTYSFVFVDKNGNVGTYNTGLNAEIKGYNNKAMNTNITHTME